MTAPTATTHRHFWGYSIYKLLPIDSESQYKSIDKARNKNNFVIKLPSFDILHCMVCHISLSDSFDGWFALSCLSHWTLRYTNTKAFFFLHVYDIVRFIILLFIANKNSNYLSTAVEVHLCIWTRSWQNNHTWTMYMVSVYSKHVLLFLPISSCWCSSLQ